MCPVLWNKTGWRSPVPTLFAIDTMVTSGGVQTVTLETCVFLDAGHSLSKEVFIGKVEETRRPILLQDSVRSLTSYFWHKQQCQKCLCWLPVPNWKMTFSVQWIRFLSMEQLRAVLLCMFGMCQVDCWAASLFHLQGLAMTSNSVVVSKRNYMFHPVDEWWSSSDP